MNSQPNAAARPSRSAPAEPADMLAWPVLASLPRVGAQRVPPRATMHADHSNASVEYVAQRTSDMPALRIATLADAPEEFEPLAHAAASAARGTIELRTFIDQPHLTVRGYDWPAGGGGRIAEEPAAVPAPPSTHRRIDAGSRRSSASTAPKSSRTPEPVSRSLAARVFQLHAAFAPHAGMVMTLALAASVGLLCWFTMGRPNVAADDEHVLDGPAGWPAETATTPTTEGAAGESAAPDQFVSEFAWRMSPTSEPAPPVHAAPKVEVQPSAAPPSSATTNVVATLAAPTLDLTAPTAPSGAVAPSSISTPGPAEKATAPETAPPSTIADVAPVSAPAAPVAKAAASQAPEPITPTPHEGPYPTTPYGAFNYFAEPAPAPPTASAATVQPSVASRPVEASAAPTATR